MCWNDLRRFGSSGRARSSNSNTLSTVLILLATLFLGFELGLLLPLMTVRNKTDPYGNISSAVIPSHLPQPVHQMHNLFVRSSFKSLDDPSTNPHRLPPYVQSLSPDWQQRWLGGPTANSSTYRTIADATCLLYHQTDERQRCVLPRTDVELVTEMNVVFVMCGEGVRELTVTSMKSFMLHRHPSATLHVWLMVSPFDTQRQFIVDTLSRWPPEHQPHPINKDVPASNSSVFLHFLDMDALLRNSNSSILERAREHLGLFKQCATTRLWLPQLLPSHLSLVLFVDCDTLVVRDYRQMFAHAQLYSPTQFISFAYEGISKLCGSWYFLFPPPSPAPAPYAINSGVLLLNLSHVRSAAMQQLYSEQLLSILSSGRHLELGDQDVYNAWIGAQQSAGRDYFFPLPGSYNWRECNFVPPGEPGGLTLLHGNAYKFGNMKEEAFWGHTWQSYYLWPKLPSNPTMKIKEDGK